MKKVFSMFGALLVSAMAMGQQADPVIMKINGKNVTRSEFEYSFNKNNSDGVIDKKTVKEYVPLFVDFKLKVAEAQAQGIDTIASIRKELDGYKEQMVIPTIVDSAFIEREAVKTYENTAARFGGEDMLTASHILILLNQNASAEQQSAAKARIDSVYSVLKAVPAEQLAERFAEMAQNVSDDKGSAVRGGALGQFGKGMMIPDFENAAFALKAGEMSAPFLSTVGYHIILMQDRHPFEPYEFHRESILKFLAQRGIQEASANAYVDSIAKMKNISRNEVIDELHANLVESDPEVKYLAQEYYDGTLMYEVSKNDVWDKSQQDVAGQEAYFKAHKKDYTWDSPRFCGIVIHAKDAQTIAKAKKMLKKVAEENYATTLTGTFNNDSVRLVRIEKGLFKQGDNAVVDNAVFKQKAEIKPMKDYPYADVYGKKAKSPRTLMDVKGAVATDFQNQQEKIWVERLRKKFSVEVYDDVVNTVNNH